MVVPVLLFLMIVMVMMVMMLFFLFLHARSFLGMLRGESLPLSLFLFVLPVGFFHELKRQILCIFHDFQDARAGQFVPGRRQDAGLRVLLTDQRDGLVQFLLGNALRAAQDDRACVLDLVVIELAEVLHVDLALLRIRHGGRGIQDQVAFLGTLLDGGHHVGKLADAGGLDQDTIGSELRHDLLEGFAEVADQRAANAAGIHFGDLDACLPKEAAVDADLAELIFNEDDFLVRKRFLEKFLDERGLARAQET